MTLKNRGLVGYPKNIKICSAVNIFACQFNQPRPINEDFNGNSNVSQEWSQLVNGVFPKRPAPSIVGANAQCCTDQDDRQSLQSKSIGYIREATDSRG